MGENQLLKVIICAHKDNLLLVLTIQINILLGTVTHYGYKILSDLLFLLHFAKYAQWLLSFILAIQLIIFMDIGYSYFYV